MSKYYTNNMSFKQKSLQRSVENTSGVDDWAPENEEEMSSSFELLYKYFDTKNRATKQKDGIKISFWWKSNLEKVKAFQTGARN